MIARPEQYADPFATFVARLQQVKHHGDDHVTALCPVHEKEGSTPSYDVRRGKNGGVVGYCHSQQCSFEAAVEAVGLTMRDVSPSTPSRNDTAKSRKPQSRYPTVNAVAQMFSRLLDGTQTTFDYHNADGSPNGVVFRFDYTDGKPKAIRQARLDGTDWIAEAMLEPRTLFRLQLLIAKDIDEPVLVVEGEKKADACAALGFVATTSSQGAKCPAKTDWAPLKGRRVVILPDNDEPGRKYCGAVAKLVRAAGAASVRVLELEGLEEGEDVADWIATFEREGIPRDDIAARLRELVAAAPAMPEPEAQPEPETKTIAEPREEEADEARVPFPVDALPPVLRRIVVEGARQQNVDAAFFAVPLLPILTGAVGASRQVLVRRGWLEPSILWAAPVAVSGAGKSPPIEVMLRPLRQRDEDLLHRSHVAHEDHKARLAEWNRAQRRKDGADSGPAPEPPARLCCLVDDVTCEALAVRLTENPRGCTLAADELATWLGSFDAYRSGRGADEAKWLGIYGARPLKVDRKVGGTIYVARPHVSVVGGIQPRVAARVLGKQQRESGLAARLLLAMPPTRACLWTDEYVPQATLDEYGRVVRSLLDLSVAADQPTTTLRLSDEARDLFRAAHDEFAESGAAAASQGDEDAAASHAKLRSAVPRIALALHLARAAEGGCAELAREVDGEAMAGAIAIGRYFGSEAQAIYASWARETPDRHAMLDGKVLAALRGDPKPTTDLHAAMGRNLKASELRGSLCRLVDAGLVLSETIQGAVGRPTEQWRVAP